VAVSQLCIVSRRQREQDRGNVDCKSRYETLLTISGGVEPAHVPGRPGPSGALPRTGAHQPRRHEQEIKR